MPGLIRRSQVTGFNPFSFADLDDQRRRIAEQARREAERVIAEARAAAEHEKRTLVEKARREAMERGRAEGVERAHREASAAALQDARQHLARLAQALTAAVEQYEGAKRALLAHAERSLLRLGLAIAERVCKRRAERDPGVAAENLRALLDGARHFGDLVVRLNPVDAAALSEFDSTLAARIDAMKHARIEPDASLARGDCRLEAREGTLDASIAAQLERVAHTLLGEDNGTHSPRREESGS